MLLPLHWARKFYSKALFLEEYNRAVQKTAESYEPVRTTPAAPAEMK